MESHLSTRPRDAFSNSVSNSCKAASGSGEQSLVNPDPRPLSQRGEAKHAAFAETEYTMNTGISGTSQSGANDARASASPGSSLSGDSLNNHKENKTPTESPTPEYVTTTSGVPIGQLSLDPPVKQSWSRPQPRKVLSQNDPPSASAHKRNAPIEPDDPIPSHGSTHEVMHGRSLSNDVDSPGLKRARGNDTTPQCKPSPGASPRSKPRNHSRGLSHSSHKAPLRKQHSTPKVKDARYKQEAGHSPQHATPTTKWCDIPHYDPRPSKSKYPGLILEPQSTPISKDQLAVEVKGIYAGLVMVEAKCINIDAAQAADPDSQLGPEQWGALIALHRTLLYEHHDFLMATQHPSATPALRGLASKYSMPARMWRHGIHSFLEVLRFRRPQSQDYMIAFIYLAYQMMALLYETVPMFTDTWIECLGDLARYRMAIEDNREAHGIWGGVAGRWYNIASDRHSEIGRLYHHLGILERPSVRKLFLYTKALTCLVPFPNAKDSLSTLCTPIVQSQNHCYSGDTSAEARIVTFLALVYLNSDAVMIQTAASEAVSRLALTPASKVQTFGVELVISSIGALFELGAARNALWQSFGKVVGGDNQNSRPSINGCDYLNATFTETEKQLLTPSTTQPAPIVTEFVFSVFSTLIRLGKDEQSAREMLPTIHTILVWFYNLHSFQSRMADDNLERHTSSALTDLKMFSWGALSNFLNLILQIEPVGARTLQFARQGMFLVAERSEDATPLNEDYMLRGLKWTPGFYPTGWFGTQPDDGGRAIETKITQKARLERVQWLALYLAFRIEYLNYDLEERKFYVPGSVPEVESMPAAEEEPVTQTGQPQPASVSTTETRTSSTPSAYSDDEGHVVITKKRSVRGTRRVKSSVTTSKPRAGEVAVRVVDPDRMEWEGGE